MKSLWQDAEAAGFPGDLGQRVYSSRLLGRAPSLVLHGGGNTSVKSTRANLFGEQERIVLIKGSGWDLATIEGAGFSPCLFGPLVRLATLPELSDLQMAAELRRSLTDPAAPMPSVEAILHALIPSRFVDHTHADALIALTNAPDAEARIRQVYGSRVLVIPYVMPGFKLARACADALRGGLPSGVIGLVLMNHGLVSFGDSARESYERMIELVTLAEDHLRAKGALEVSWPDAPASAVDRAGVAQLRRDMSAVAGRPLVLSTRRDARSMGFARDPRLRELCSGGPATPDHVIRTKRLPLVGRDLGAYRAAYEAYFAQCAARVSPRPQALDPAPRVVVDPDWGVLSAGPTAADAAIAGDLFAQTIDIIARAERLGGWRALPAQDIFDVEYWDLEQAKLRTRGKAPAFTGEVAVVTGAASGIGKACVEELLARGAAVVGLDLNPAVATVARGPAYLGLACDLTQEQAVSAAIDRTVLAFGGVDILVLNAGIFLQGKAIADLDSATWRKVMAVNLDAPFALMRECHPLLKRAPGGGRVAIIGSKNVPAPGPGAAAYSASKAAVNQLARVAALEWGADNIRVNSVHPNMVFDTGLWSEEVLASRARHYGLSVEAYKTNNVLRTVITSRDVAALVAELCGAAFSKTTAAQVPIDGGNDRVI